MHGAKLKIISLAPENFQNNLGSMDQRNKLILIMFDPSIILALPHFVSQHRRSALLVMIQ